ncbi:arginine--tRNA ligase [Simiduia curdlanivorans]|uniref:Arginine--tRNA ligase n=1 Tax=Simiduia curdlanivorans TaxID=1492769 RepID=A0ABV8V4V1_9GAMM|nr:arginine--tRNA ligase [Simiduia curdlanivorans]MDN3640519.1 arginine--tRNA ligase [Simiduia curdlanivorans]
MNIRQLLTEKAEAAMLAAGIPAGANASVAPSKKAGFGDYQINGAMAAAKQLKTNPRELAARIVEYLDLTDIATKVEVAGPGFINIDLNPAWLSDQVTHLLHDARLALDKVAEPLKVVIDYSAPNLAKEMHVGHIRSTIIGDSLARLLEFQGHKVIRQNHVGDWGTQFGMLIAELEEHLAGNESANIALKDLEKFYQQSKQHFDQDENFAQKARDYVVKLQGGDARILELWQEFKSISLAHGEENYRKLNVTLTPKDVMGESAYNDDLPVLVADLVNKGIAVEDQGAKVAFLDEMKDKEGNPSVVIIQKQGGGFLYATTDLAAMRHRVNTLGANRIMYFIDARQSLHMQQVFTLGRKAGYAGDAVSLEHHAFGTMMGTDGKPFKTRSGGTVKLAELLDEAVERATKVVAEKNTELSSQEVSEIGRKVGIGAVKYADLSKTRTNDYVFNWDAMLAFEGNTGPYLQYAYTRIQSIFRKAGGLPTTAVISLETEQEKALALRLLQLAEAFEQMSTEALPHVLCNYLYELASLYMSFYEACPMLKEGIDEQVKNSRLMLSQATAKTLALGLDMLGIEVSEKM